MNVDARGVAAAPSQQCVCATVLKWRVYFLSLVCLKAIFSREPSLVLQIVARDQARLARLGAIDAQRLE
jgi:hypothetical protein